MLTAEGLVGELALSGRLETQELRRWLSALGVDEQRVVVLAFSVSEPDRGVEPLEAILSQAGAPGAVTVCDGLLCAVAGAQAVAGLAVKARRQLSERLGETRAAVSRPGPPEALRGSFHEARGALAAAAATNGDAPEVASYEDLGAARLLLTTQDPDTLSAYCHTVLGSVEGEEGEYGEELLHSLDVFIEHNGHWEQAAKALYCHRHTLRYRVRRVEQLTGRDFSHARDRIEFWLALRGRELTR